MEFDKSCSYHLLVTSQREEGLATLFAYGCKEFIIVIAAELEVEALTVIEDT
jgi:hypothetical protein